MLEMVTDMESTYLTKVDNEARLQHIMLPVIARKCTSRRILPSRGITRYANAPLMKTVFSDEVPDWGAVLRHAILASPFLSTPIHLPDGSFYGTLCAASSEKRQWSERAEQVLQLFAGLIAQYIQKKRHWLNSCAKLMLR